MKWELFDVVLFLLTATIWGSAFLFFDIALDDGVPLYWITVIRFVTGALLFMTCVVVWMAASEAFCHHVYPVFRWNVAKKIIAIGLFNTFLPIFLLYCGEAFISDTSVVSLLVSLSPLFAVILASHLLPKTNKITSRVVVGFLFGICGLVCVFISKFFMAEDVNMTRHWPGHTSGPSASPSSLSLSSPSPSSSSSSPYSSSPSSKLTVLDDDDDDGDDHNPIHLAFGLLLIVVSSMVTGFGGVLSERFLINVHPFVNAASQTVVGAVAAVLAYVPFALFAGSDYMDMSWVENMSVNGWLSVLYQGVFSAFVAFAFFFVLIERVGATPMLTCWMLFPLYGIVEGWIFLGQFHWNSSSLFANDNIALFLEMIGAVSVVAALLFLLANKRRTYVSLQNDLDDDEVAQAISVHGDSSATLSQTGGSINNYASYQQYDHQHPPPRRQPHHLLATDEDISGLRISHHQGMYITDARRSLGGDSMMEYDPLEGNGGDGDGNNNSVADVTRALLL